MSSKESYCYRILKSHSLIVDFDGLPSKKNVPSVIEGETFKKWKTRVLGDEVSNVVVYYAMTPSNQTKMKTLQGWCQTEHLQRMFTKLSKDKAIKSAAVLESTLKQTTKTLQARNEIAVNNAIKQTEKNLQEKNRIDVRDAVSTAVRSAEKKLETFPKGVLEDLLNRKEGEIEPSVREFFNRFLISKKSNINTEEILESFIDDYNSLVQLTKSKASKL